MSNRIIGRTNIGEEKPRQIRQDRYYAAHLLADLKNPRGVPILVSLLRDPHPNRRTPLLVPGTLRSAALQGH